MSDYTKSTNFAAKDALASGNAAKVVKGTEIDTEFNNIATAIATKADTTAVDLKADIASPAFTGNPTAPTPTAGDNDTSIATTAFVTTAVAALGYHAFKNRIINGAMMIDQRNAGASVTIPATNNTYTVDRWLGYGSQASKFTVQQNAGSVTPPTGFINYLGATSSSAYTVGSAEQFLLMQPIEGLNVSDFGWGSASAATVTLSFWVRSSLTGIFGGSLRNASVNRSYVFSYTVNSANTWEQKSITIAGDTSGTWATNNGVGIYLCFGIGVGSTLSGSAGSWSGSNLVSVTGAQSVVGTNAATFYITGVQLEKGSTATSFDYRPYGTELALCQRYYQVIPSTYAFGYCAGNSTLTGGGGISLRSTMRSAPTLDANKAGTYSVSGGSAGTTGLWYATTDTVNFLNGSSNWTANNLVYLATSAGLTSEL